MDPPKPKRNVLPPVERWALFATVLVDGILAVALAVRDASLVHSASGTLGSALWLVAGVVNLAAAYGVIRRFAFWLVASVIGQSFVTLLALYVIVIDLRSPVLQLKGVTGGALLIGLVGVAWVCRLVRYVPRSIHRGLAAMAALFPLLGLAQFWLETDYLPRHAIPQVDIQAELKEVGRSGSTIHLAADVALHNRGAVEADSIGSLVKVTAYPAGTTRSKASPSAIARAMDQGMESREFRDEPLPADAHQLLYANDFFPVASFLTAGETDSFRVLVDVDASTVAHVRMSAQVALIPKRSIGVIHSCDAKALTPADPHFVDRITKPTVAGQWQWVCAETDLAPENVVQDLVADHPSVRTVVFVAGPKSFGEYPMVFFDYAAGGSSDQLFNEGADQKVSNANPTGIADDSDEFEVGDTAPGR